MEENLIKKKSLFKSYSIIFIISFLIIFLPFFIKNLNISMGGLYPDGFTQHLLFMRDYVIEIKEWLFKGQEFNLYNFNIGYGADIIQSYGYYSLFDPFNIIAVLLPIKWIEFSFYLILFIKIFLSGYFFCLFAKKFNIKNELNIVVSAIFYCLGLCTLFYSLRHPIFASSFVILPLAFLGVEKAVRGESKILLVCSTFLAILVQFYLGVYIILGMELYLMFRLCKDKISFKKWFLLMIKYNLYILLGIVMSAFVLFTQTYALSMNGRVDGNTMVGYSFEYYLGLITSALIPVSGSRYAAVTGNFFATFLILLFALYHNDYKWLKKIIILEASFLLFSIFGYTFSLFSYVNNRWSFIMMMPLSLALAFSLDNFQEFTLKNKSNVYKILSYALLVLLFCGVSYLNKTFVTSILLKVILYIVIIALFVLFGYLLNKINYERIKINFKNITKAFLVVHVGLMIFLNIGYSVTFYGDYIFDEYYSNEFSSEQVNDDTFYRVSKNDYVANQDFFTNDSIYGNYSSTFSFNTMNNGNIVELMRQLEVNNGNSNVGYNGLNNRYVLETLFGVKYFISKESSYDNVPYNFSYLDSFDSHKYEEIDYASRRGRYDKDVMEKTNIYSNNNYLSLGYVYNSCINSKDINSLNGLQKQDLMLENIILDNDICSSFSSSLNSSNSIKEKEYELVLSDGITLNNNKIVVSEKDAYIQVNVSSLENEELYIKFTSLKNKDESKKSRYTYVSSNMENVIITQALGTHLYSDNTNQLVNMGYYSSKDNETIKIYFNSKGEYSYDDFKVYTYSMDNVISKINNLANDQLEDIEITSNQIKGNLNSSKDGLLLLTIPYNEGFKAYVNGKEVPIYNADIGFMAIEVKEGNNEIVLKYQTMLLKEGLIVSSIAFTIFLIYIPFEIYYKKKKQIKDDSFKTTNKKIV